MDYDISPLKVKSQYSYEDYREYYMFSLFRGKRYRLGIRIFFIAYPALIALVALMTIYSGPDPFLIVCEVILVFIFVLFLFMIYYFTRKNYGNIKKLFTSGVIFEFRNNDFIIKQKNNLYTGESAIKYEALYKVYETETMFYVFITPRQAFLINKNGIIDDNPNSLRTILMNEVDRKKYIKCFKE